jgi:hypothetical protein
MPTNEAITSGLVFPGQVPADRECEISNLSEIIQGVVDFTSIQTTNPDGTPTPPDDSVAQLALSQANAALALAQSVQASQKETRSSSPQAIPTGDSTTTFNWNPPLPSTNYDINITIYAGAVGHPSAYYGWRVLASSVSTGGVSILLDNIPANSSASYRVVMR